MPKKDGYNRFNIFERKIKSPFMIYADFETILVPEDNGKQNPDESYTNKYQKYIACSYGYKLVCADDKFSKSFKSHLHENAIYNFINNMIKESNYCSDVMKKHFNKELVVTKEDKDFENFIKWWICDNDYVDHNVKVRDHYRITGKYRSSAHRDCNINIKSQSACCISQPTNYDSHLILQELGKFSLQ